MTRRLLLILLVLWPSVVEAQARMPPRSRVTVRAALEGPAVAAAVAHVRAESGAAGLYLWMTDGPLTPLMNLRARTNENGYLMVVGGAAGATDGPLTAMANLRGRTNENGYLMVTFGAAALFAASGTCVTPSITFTGDTDSGIGWLGANNVAGCAGGATIFDWNATRVLFAQPIQISTALGADAVTLLNTNSTATTAGFRAENTVAAAGGAASFSHRKSNNTADARIVDHIFQDGGVQSFRYLNDAENAATTWLTTTGSSSSVSSATLTATAISLTGSVTSTVKHTTPILQGSGTGTSVANVGANSCGTSAATIAGNQVSGVITVGATSGTQCRVTFSTAAPVARDCTVTDSTTTIATRATAVSTTAHDFFGAFTAGDLVTFICMVR